MSLNRRNRTSGIVSKLQKRKRWRMKTIALGKFAAGHLTQLRLRSSDVGDWPGPRRLLVSGVHGQRMFVPQSLKHDDSRSDFFSEADITEPLLL